MKTNKTISVVISAILCSGILFTGCGGGSDVKSNTPESVIQDTSENSDGDLNNITENPSIEEIGSFTINNYSEIEKGVVDYNNAKVFISDQVNLYIYDISNISEPKFSNIYGLYGGGHNIVLSEDNKLFIDNLTSLKILDVTNPKAINEIGEYKDNGFIEYFVLSSDRKTAFTIINNSLSIIDINDTANPELVKKIELSDVNKLQISNDDKKLYAMFKGTKKGLAILDLTDKENPVLKDEYLINDNTIVVNDVAISKDNSIALLSTSKGLIILDISNPDDIQEITTYSSNHTFNSAIIASNKKRVFALDKQNLKVAILDIVDPENPEEINSIDFLETYSTPHNIFLSNDETKLFVATTVSGEGSNPITGLTKIYIFDVSSYTNTK